ncbi:MAG: putative glycosyltransferase [Candidatus Scalindua rubra]|uniref:Putative glycosyltransferase n=1 Tax=Candidatus Scalindua rubra TaxID=1872076 RepID=A0A1E3X6N7_9BACT|nr:MAG: putative glycosyltransferase [Candidatus Scalindua rubra]
MEIHGKLLSEGLTKRGHEVTIISTKNPSNLEFEEINGIKINYLQNTVFGSKRKNWPNASLNKFLELNDRNPFDIILSQQSSAYSFPRSILKKNKIPLITRVAGTQLDMLMSVYNQTLNFKRGFLDLFKEILRTFYNYLLVELPLYHKSTEIIVVNHKLANSLKRFYFVDKEKTNLVFHGTNTEIFKPDKKLRDSIKDKYRISTDCKILLIASTVSKQKGFNLALIAFKKIFQTHPNIKLLVVGEGIYLEDLKRLAHQLNVQNNVIFTGHVANEEIFRYYNASDIFLLPTLRVEGFPRVLVEAMSCKKPIVASRIGGIPSIIDDGKNGLLITPGNTKELIDKILFLLNNKDFANKLAVNAREKAVKIFSLEKMVEETIKVFELAITRKKEQG